MDKKRLIQIIGGVDIEDSPTGFVDNLAIALATYFDKHLERPDDDEADGETGWGNWVLEKTNEALARIADEVLSEMEKEP